MNKKTNIASSIHLIIIYLTNKETEYHQQAIIFDYVVWHRCGDNMSTNNDCMFVYFDLPWQLFTPIISMTTIFYSTGPASQVVHSFLHW